MNKIKSGVTALVATGIVLVGKVALATTPLSIGTDAWSKGGLTNASGAGLPQGTVFSIIHQIMNWLLGILGFISIIGFVISGILYLTAAGDEGRIETAKTAMVYSIVGVLVALVGFVIVQAVNAMLGGGSNNF